MLLVWADMTVIVLAGEDPDSLESQEGSTIEPYEGHLYFFLKSMWQDEDKPKIMES